MKIEDIDSKIKQLQGVIIEASARLEAWSEVRSAFEEGKQSSRVSLGSGIYTDPPRISGITEQIYSVFPELPRKFTSADVVERMKSRFGDLVDSRKISTSVCSFLHSVTNGKLKNPRYVIKVCGSREGYKLYTQK